MIVDIVPGTEADSEPRRDCRQMSHSTALGRQKTSVVKERSQIAEEAEDQERQRGFPDSLHFLEAVASRS